MFDFSFLEFMEGLHRDPEGQLGGPGYLLSTCLSVLLNQIELGHLYFRNLYLVAKYSYYPGPREDPKGRSPNSGLKFSEV